MTHAKLLSRWSAFAFLGICLAACGSSSSSSGGGDTGDCPAPAYLNLTGVWSVQDILDGDCESELQRFQVHIEQNGDTLEIRGTATFTAHMCGSRASIQQPFSYVRNSGVHEVSSLTITFTTATAFNGTSRWTWTPLSGAGGCSGTSSFEGVR